MEFLMENISTIIVGLVILGIAFLAGRSIYRDRKAGKSCGSCGGSCGGCANSDHCHPPKE